MVKQASNTKVLIMCGGKGTRMWPISNIAHPKQFESILGERSMFRETLDRVFAGFDPKDVYIATSSAYHQQIKEQAKEIPIENFILEPAMRDNLGALGLATALINKRHPGAVMILLWGADHLVKKVDVFLDTLKKAAALAATSDKMILVDAWPTYPTVHNGWIQIGAKVDNVEGSDVYEFIRQVEKPSLEKAREFYASDKYLIHTGYLATKTAVMLGHYQTFSPHTYKIIDQIIQSVGTPSFQSVLETWYPKFDKLSVDYGLYEKLPPSSQLEMPSDFGWVDVGTWELLYHGLDKDANGNVVIGQAHLIDTKNCLVIGKSGHTGVIGMRNAIVVETDEGMLVCDMDQAPKVKDLYNQLYEKV